MFRMAFFTNFVLQNLRKNQNSMKKVAFFLVTLVLVVMTHAQNVTTQKHEIQSGETLYSIARQYNVSVSYLLEINPGLQADYIMAGQSINVPSTAQQTATHTENAQPISSAHPVADGRPKYKAKHEVQKKETIYSLSRQYGVTEEQLIEANPSLKKGKLKKGAIINIPFSDEDNRQYVEQQQRIKEEEQKPKVQMYPTIKVAIILPFSLVETKMTVEAQKMTNLYQGFLLAVDSLKQRGCSVEVHAYDEAVNDEDFTRILNQRAVREANLILGPVRPYHLQSVARVAHENKIAHVVPLSNDMSIVNEHPMLFQVNLPYSLLYSQVYNRFVIAHRNDNIIFVNMNDRGDNMNYISGFKKVLDEMSISYKSADVTDMHTVRDALIEGRTNVIVPSSGSSSAFENLCKKMEGMNLGEEFTVQMFGFPEWQTFQQKYEKNLAKYRCQFFTSFYSNSGSMRTQQFNSRFRRWFNQEQYSSFPRYGEMGYDIGAYFLKGLNDYGSAFCENLHNYSYLSLEFPFNFEKRNQESGFQNRSLFFVTYKLDGTVDVR